jgi:hypothetical protein
MQLIYLKAPTAILGEHQIWMIEPSDGYFFVNVESWVLTIKNLVVEFLSVIVWTYVLTLKNISFLLVGKLIDKIVLLT